MANVTASKSTELSGHAVWWQSRAGRQRLTHVALHIVLLALSVTFLLPLLWLLSTSLKQSGSELSYPPQWIPNPIEWVNYKTALVDLQPTVLYLRNTIMIAGGVTVGDVLMASLAAYGYARLRFPGRNLLFIGTLATLMLPGMVTLVPTFIMMRYLHWIDTYLPLIVPSWFGGNAFSIFLLRQFFLTIPLELDEAARIDGASPVRIWWNVILPLSGPALATVAIFDVLNSWNDFLGPLIYINSPQNFTLALGLGQFQLAHQQTLWNYMMAASAAMIAPVIVLFFVAQRYFMRGIVTTGLAGR
jgi:multiple sugar transport system permease protein